MVAIRCGSQFEVTSEICCSYAVLLVAVFLSRFFAKTTSSAFSEGSVESVTEPLALADSMVLMISRCVYGSSSDHCG